MTVGQFAPDPASAFAQTIRSLERRIADLERAARPSGSHTPTLTNIAIGTGGNAANTSEWSFDNGWLNVSGYLTLGTSGASVSNSPILSIPAGFSIADGTGTATARVIGQAYFVDGGVADSYGIVRVSPSSQVRIDALTVSGSKLVRSNLGASTPFTWAAGDEIKYQYRVRADRT